VDSGRRQIQGHHEYGIKKVHFRHQNNHPFHPLVIQKAPHDNAGCSPLSVVCAPRTDHPTRPFAAEATSCDLPLLLAFTALPALFQVSAATQLMYSPCPFMRLHCDPRITGFTIGSSGSSWSRIKYSRRPSATVGSADVKV
jgi:hypothetical protein